MLAQVIENYGVSVIRHQAKTPGGYYAIDHTGGVFIVDQRGKLRNPHPADADTLGVEVRGILAEKDAN
jgi:cytochrome oxidase Cu insertion factor (SCO1/SenC/PrrC family)